MITFQHPQYLLLLGIVPFVFWIWRGQNLPSPRTVAALTTRILVCAALSLALAGLTFAQPLDRQAVVFVGDLSASALEARGDQERFISTALAARGPDDAAAIVATARSASVEHVLSTSPNFTAFQTQPPPDGSNLAEGIRLASSLLPAEYRNRVVLLSDGQETSGDAVAQARLLRARGIEVDVVPLAVASGPEVLLDQVMAPRTVREGERFGVRVRVMSNVATGATVRVQAGQTLLAEQTVSINAGSTDLSFSSQAPAAGLLDVRATITPDVDTLPQNNEARAVVEVQGPPRVLVLEQRAGEGASIAAALDTAGMRLETRPVEALPDSLDALGSYSAVVLADVSAETLTETQQTTLRSYVRDLGRGLLSLGGDTSYGQGGYLGTPLDDALPVRSSVRAHRDQGRVALVLVVDRSGSMADDVYHEGTSKLAMAREAAILSAQQLAPRDLVGVVAFDTHQHWLVPMASVFSVGQSAIEDRISTLQADGGTDIYPALMSAYDAIKRADAQYRHIILLTDGMSCCAGDYPGAIQKLHESNITLSTIAVGGDADQKLLEQLARQGDGRYYFADHARDIPRLMTREAELATRGPLVEGDVTPRQVAPDSVLSTLAANGLPHLGGYLVTTPKDLAEVLLVSDAADPLLARWPYGLGRAVAWTSDLRGRWSEQWLGWPGTQQLFASLVSWTIPPNQGALHLDVRGGPDAAHVTVEDTQGQPQPDAQYRARVAQPGGEPLEVQLAPTAPGRFEGEFPLAGPGNYVVHVEQQRPDGSAVASAEAGLPVAYSPEFRRVSADTRRLDQIARAGGGHVLASPAAAFADDLPPVSTPLPLERSLLLLAALLLPLDVALRRLRVSPGEVLAWLRRPTRLGLARPHWPWSEGWDPYLPAPWSPGQARRRRVVPPRQTVPIRPPQMTTSVTPGLARQTDAELSEDDALAATLRWLAERRGSRGDSH